MSVLCLSSHSQFAGKYKFTVVKGSGVIVRETEWIDNIITDQGLDQIGNPPVYNTSFGFKYINTHCGVGTGSATPTVADTTLQSPLAMYPTSAGTNVEGGSISYVSGTPSYYSCVWTYTFAAGSATGNLTEVGVGGTLNGDTTPRLFSRALILDGMGNPTTLTVLSDEQLIVTYELRLYIDTTDNTYSFFINSTSYSGTYRRADVATAPNLYYGMVNTNNKIYMQACSGAIAAITSHPSGGDSGNSYSEISQTNAYVNGTYYNDFRRSFTTTDANFNINSLYTFSPHGRWQFSLSPFIPKTSSQSMQLNWRQSWSRYP